MTEHAILLHGLWMRGFSLLPLARRLRNAGLDVETFDYSSVARGPDAAVAALLERARRAHADRLHLVGHSLGGLVALTALAAAPDLPPGKVVCLGSPLAGSALARSVAHFPGGRIVLGRSAGMLTKGIDGWHAKRPLGVIAGTVPFGLGVAVGPLSAPHDGTVAVAETEIAGMREHRTVSATHVGLLFSAEVADMTAAFLRTGHFGGTA
ncbi:MAG: alpha/beta fold hydrolase [Lysobacterales bacterium]